jgi:hypothetical protein
LSYNGLIMCALPEVRNILNLLRQLRNPGCGMEQGSIKSVCTRNCYMHAYRPLLVLH